MASHDRYATHELTMRTVSIIVAMLLGAVTGCRSTPPIAADNRIESGVAAQPPIAKTHSTPVSPVAYVEEAREVAEPESASDGNEQQEALPAPIASGQQNESLTLAELEGIALQNNPSLAVAARRVEAARGRWVQVGLYPNPVIGYHATEIGNLGTAGQQGGFISQRLITGGKRQLDQELASREIQEAEFLFDAQQRRVLSDVRIRFYNALIAQRRVELTRNLARIGDELVQASVRLLEGRQVSQDDFLRAEIEAEEAYILFDNARNEDVESWRRLAAVIGVPTMQMAPRVGDLDDRLPKYQWEDAYQMVLSQSPELEAARTRIERARIALKRACRETIPDVDVSVSVRHHNVTEDNVANVQVGIPIPIFDANQGNVDRAQAEWAAAQSDAQRMELDLQDRLAVAYRRYQNAHQQVGRYRDRILSRAQKSLGLVTNAYEQGQANYLTLITSQQTFIRVNLAYLDAVRELRESNAVIEGQLLRGSLTSP